MTSLVGVKIYSAWWWCSVKSDDKGSLLQPVALPLNDDGDCINAVQSSQLRHWHPGLICVVECEGHP